MVRAKIIVIAALAGAVTTLALIAPAAGATTARRPSHPRTGRDADDRVNYGQLAADAVAEKVKSAVAAQHIPGFAGDAVNPSPTHPGLTVYWHGPVPATLRRAAASYASPRGTGIAAGVVVSFKRAPYTQAQLLSLQAAINNVPGYWHLGISSMGFYPPATGFWVGVSTRADLAKVRALGVIKRSAIRIHYFVSPAVPLTLADPRTALAPVAGRWKDKPAFSGGDFIKSKWHTLPIECSDAFAMHFANKKGAPFFLLTAAHCIVHQLLGTQAFWVQGNGLHIGTTFTYVGDDDAATLDTRGGVRGAGGAHTIYVGNTSMKNVNGQSKAVVKGAMSIEPKNLVSTSGAYSGERTRIKIVTTTWEWSAATVDGQPYRVFGARAIKTNHSNAAGHGDSGGPVFINVKGGVKAVGIISATSFPNHKAICTGIVAHRTCYWDINIPLMTGTATSIEAQLNITVNVG